MGTLARSTARASGAITGVVPSFLRVREQGDALPFQDLVVTPDLFERKRYMLTYADCYLALPGGYGTLDEVLEVIALAALGIHNKPTVLVNVERAWDPFLHLANMLRKQGFATSGLGEIFHVADTPRAALDLLERTSKLAGYSYQEVL